MCICVVCVPVKGDICRDLHANAGPHPGADRCVFNVTTEREEGCINLSLGEREKSIHRAQGHGVAVLFLCSIFFEFINVSPLKVIKKM